MPWALEKIGSFILIEWEVKKFENTANARFTQGLLQLLFLFFDQKASKWAYNVIQFFISYLVLETYEVYYTILFIAFEFVFILNQIFCLPKNPQFFRSFAYKSLLNRFLVWMNYIMWSSNHFSTSSSFPRFSGSRFFRIQVF